MSNTHIDYRELLIKLMWYVQSGPGAPIIDIPTEGINAGVNFSSDECVELKAISEEVTERDEARYRGRLRLSEIKNLLISKGYAPYSNSDTLYVLSGMPNILADIYLVYKNSEWYFEYANDGAVINSENDIRK